MIEKIKTLFSEIRENESIDIKALELNDYAAKASDLEYVEGRKTVDKLFIDLYKELNGLVIDWAAKEARHDDVLGKAKILPFQESIVNWKGIVFLTIHQWIRLYAVFFRLIFLLMKLVREY